MNPNIIEKANRIVNSAADGYIGLIDEKGFPSVSTVSSIKTKGIYMAYFSTGLSGNKARRILANPAASVCYRQGADNVTLVGTARVLVDAETKHALWQDWFLDHFSGGADDPEYCIIEFIPHRVSLWIDCEVAEFTISAADTVQSRCGLLCHGCSFKESCGCKGCIESMGNPFHGACPIALCCQEKGFKHCGQCPQMPCQKLREYSIEDKAHGDNPPGARLEMLKRWKSLE